MNNIKVNFCGNCPFLYSDYNPDSAGYSTIDICQLASFLKKKLYNISVHDECGRDSNSKTPDWCPLKVEDFSFTFKEFSSKRKQEIKVVSDEIDELEDFFDGNYCDSSYENTTYDAKANRLQELYTKLQELNKSEENVEFFNDEFKQKVEEFKEQIASLEIEGNKLQDLVINLTKNINEGNKD